MSGDWSRYWRSPRLGLEAMHAHFERHTYHRHSHETYSFGITDDGRQAFTCRGAGHTSTPGMVMAFNPDDPHDGWAADELGFTYRIVHIGPELVSAALAGVADRAVGLPLFAEPVVHDPVLVGGLGRLHTAILGGAPALVADELLDAVVPALVRRAALSGPVTRSPRFRAGGRGTAGLARRAAELLEEDYRTDHTADSLAALSGSSRFTLYRAFRAAYGMAPSEYQRQVRLRAARGLLSRGLPIADVAAETGFADQSHLTRWFVRYYGITPGVYHRAARRG
ncbi:AraC family transcriptional regulator [Streptosporangium sp. NPDC000095]|uniref:helix-turn-helix transcriptional regulator n=1 Tax=Streptosporangium sp. NPDC000095 TaxID=3366184 RepID=UPI0036B887BD